MSNYFKFKTERDLTDYETECLEQIIELIEENQKAKMTVDFTDYFLRPDTYVIQ